MISAGPGPADRDCPPRLRRVPPSVRDAGAQMCELAERLGLVLLGHQRLLLAEGSGADAAGRWSSFINVIIAPRQVGKSEVLLVRVLAALFVFGERTVLVSAHEGRTTADLFRRLRGLIEANPWLGGRIAKVTYSHGSEAVELDTGARVQFHARSTSSARGFSADLLIIDECHVLDGEAIGALLPTAAARGNAQVWACASAGTETSYVLAAWRDRALTGADPGIGLWEWSAAEDARPDDPATWLACNPGVPALISLEYVRREHQALPPEVFARERLAVSRWPADDRDRWAVVSRAEWDACRDFADERIPPCSLGVAVDPVTRRAAAIGGAWTGADGLVHLGVADHRSGAPPGWVAPRLVQLVAAYQAGAVAFDRDRAAGPLGLGDVIGDAAAVCPKAAELAQACASLADAVANRTVRHLGDERLTAAVGAAKVRTMGGMWLWDHHAPGAELLWAVTLALHAHASGAGEGAEAGCWLADFGESAGRDDRDVASRWEDGHSGPRPAVPMREVPVTVLMPREPWPLRGRIRR